MIFGLFGWYEDDHDLTALKQIRNKIASSGTKKQIKPDRGESCLWSSHLINTHYDSPHTKTTAVRVLTFDAQNSSKQYFKIQFLTQRKHNASSLLRSTA
jgi:hypothetical protein